MLWLVKWPDHTAAIVLADDEAELADILDQQGDPFGATFEIYDGPLWIEFQSITEHNTPEELCGHEDEPRRPILAPDTDDASNMHRMVIERTHPAYCAASQRAYDEERDMTADELSEALRKDDKATLRRTFDPNVFDGTPLGNLYKNGQEIAVDLEGPLRVAKLLGHHVPSDPDLEVIDGGLNDEGDGPKPA